MLAIPWMRIILANWRYIAIVVAAVAGYLYIYNRGYEAATVKYEAILNEQKERAREASDRASKALRDRQLIEEAVTQALLEELRKNETEADKDPNRDRPALGLPSVLRLNKIR